MQPSFFDLDNRYAQLSKQGDPLEKLSAVIDWELFRPIIERMDAKPRKSLAGRKPTDRVLMFKVLILQRLHNLADERLEFQIKDRLSFMRFLGIELAGNVPDARTVWAFREELKEHRLVDALFDAFNAQLLTLGVSMKSGQIIDATFVPVPIQRNSRSENKQIKQGQSKAYHPDEANHQDNTPTEWTDTSQYTAAQSKNKIAHKDLDARWTKKNQQSHYGYKGHINIDAKTKLIAQWVATDASVHDSQALEAVLRTPEQGGVSVHADSAYRSAQIETMLADKQLTSQIHERAYTGKLLTDEQTKNNKVKSKIRARVEHVFGHMQTAMGGMLIRSIGMARAHVAIGLMNLTYNLTRIECLIRNQKIKLNRTGKIGAPCIKGLQ
jgi:IS5 family transposase